MAGEIAHYAAEGVRSFIILQPFGCLPNHVCGRGVTKRLKELYPGVQIRRWIWTRIPAMPTWKTGCRCSS